MKIRKQKVKNIVNIAFLLICLLLYSILVFVKSNYSNVSCEELFFHLKVPLTGSNTGFVQSYLTQSGSLLFYGIIVIILVIIYQRTLYNRKIVFKIFTQKKDNKKTREIVIKNDFKRLYLVSIAIFAVLIVLLAHQVKFFDYIKKSLRKTQIYEHEYVDPAKVTLTFPEQKRNLIYIYLESMESTYADLPSSVSNKSNLIPKLEELAMNNTSFSDTDKLGGAYQTSNVGWTMGGIFAQSSGLPLKLPIDGNGLQFYDSFMPGATTLGDILNKEDYNQEFIMGSIKEFGGREKFLTEHGSYEIYDITSAKKLKKLPDDYYVWWGYEDSKLFDFAKEEVEKLSQIDLPFNFQLITTNTHFEEGYLEDNCPIITNNKYANSVICSDQQVYDFVAWIQQQPFYENTTIVLAGDHLLMGEYLYKNKVPLSNRRVYNVFINSAVTTENKNNRVFTTLDMFPTTLASLGVEIEGDRLGLGTNLFSDQQTLPEKMGKEKFDLELASSSKFYDKNILYDKK